MVLTGFSKAFDTVRYKTLITKIFSLGFSKTFLRWLTSHLSNRFHFVQIDDQVSDKARVHFGVPQGSIPGPVLFNLYVSDLQDNLPNSVTIFQYTDDTTIYQSCHPTNLTESTENLNTALKALSLWTYDSHLALNPTKRKSTLLSTSLMACVHCLCEISLDLKISDEGRGRVKQTKLLGVHLQEHLK